MIKVGDKVRAAGPFGQFRLDRSSTRHVVLLSGGVGLTPLVAMARDVVDEERSVTFIHACEDGSVHAMGQEVRALAKGRRNMTTHFCYRLPRHEDKPGHDYDSTGFLTAGTLQSLLPLDDYDFYLCGPGPFMQALYDILSGLGVRDERIRYEFFGPATLLRKRDGATNIPPPDLKSTGEAGQPTVHFVKSGISAAWDPRTANLLEFAEEQGLMPDFSCRAGTCESCKVGLVAGEIQYLFEPFERPAEGQALICCSVPSGDVTLDL
jgi:ferredoxin-NADP reductase